MLRRAGRAKGGLRGLMGLREAEGAVGGGHICIFIGDHIFPADRQTDYLTGRCIL